MILNSFPSLTFQLIHDNIYGIQGSLSALSIRDTYLSILAECLNKQPMNTRSKYLQESNWTFACQDAIYAQEEYEDLIKRIIYDPYLPREVNQTRIEMTRHRHLILDDQTENDEWFLPHSQSIDGNCNRSRLLMTPPMQLRPNDDTITQAIPFFPSWSNVEFSNVEAISRYPVPVDSHWIMLKKTENLRWRLNTEHYAQSIVSLIWLGWDCMKMVDVPVVNQRRQLLNSNETTEPPTTTSTPEVTPEPTTTIATTPPPPASTPIPSTTPNTTITPDTPSPTPPITPLPTTTEIIPVSTPATLRPTTSTPQVTKKHTPEPTITPQPTETVVEPPAPHTSKPAKIPSITRSPSITVANASDNPELLYYMIGGCVALLALLAFFVSLVRRTRSSQHFDFDTMEARDYLRNQSLIKGRGRSPQLSSSNISANPGVVSPSIRLSIRSRPLTQLNVATDSTHSSF